MPSRSYTPRTPWHRPLLLLALLCSCREPVPDEKGGEDSASCAWHEDLDGDGHAGSTQISGDCPPPVGSFDQGADCDDQDASLHPEADERCDGLDQDCDGSVDEDAVDAPVWYTDADNDGYGAIEGAVAACEAPKGSVAQAGDCDDADASFHPGAPERCDGRDENCSGAADEAEVWYADVDGDSWGAEGSEPVDRATACAEPVRWVDTSGDCDDADSFTWPGAPERCEDGRVNDCRGDEANARAECLPSWMSLVDADLKWTGGQFLALPARTGDLDGDGLGDLALGALMTDIGKKSMAGAVYLWHGPLDAETLPEAAVSRISGAEAVDRLGWAVAGVGDSDGDGHQELLLYGDHRRVYLFEGPLSGELGVDDATTSLHATNEENQFGESMTGLGDVDDDGLDEMLIGARGNEDGVASAWLVHGPIPAREDELPATPEPKVEEYGTHIVGQEGDRCLPALAGPGDVDGDGLDDLLLGCADAFLFLGPVLGDVRFDDADLRLVTGSVRQSSVAGLGDLDADGYAELGLDSEGSVFLELGAELVGLSGTRSLDLSWSRISGALQALDGAGDVDGDGRGDVLVGVPAGHNAGGVHLYLSSDLGGEVDAASGLLLEGPYDCAHVGFLGGLGHDLDADGLSDVMAADQLGELFVLFAQGLMVY